MAPGTEPRGPAIGTWSMLLLGFYVTAFGTFLLIPACFWDDWGMEIMVRTGQMQKFYTQAGRPQQAWITSAILSGTTEPYLRQGLAFFMYLAAAFFQLNALLRIRIFAPRDAFFITLLSAIAPLNYTRFLLITSAYTQHYLLFSMGVWFLVIFLENRSILARIGALACFLWTFATTSFVMFFALPMLWMHRATVAGLVERRPLRETLRGFASTVVRHADFHLLPFAYVALQYGPLRPHGDLDGYNAFTLGCVAKAPYHSFSTSLGSMTAWMGMLDQRPGTIVVGALVALGVCALILRARPLDARALMSADTDEGTQRWKWILLFSALACAFAVFPYATVCRFPAWHEWNSRHQLTLGMVCGALWVSLLRVLLRPSMVYPACLVLAALFAGANATTYLHLLSDGHRTLAIVEALKEENARADLAGVDIAYVRDLAPKERALARTWRHYELTALLAEVHGDSTPLGWPIANGDIIIPDSPPPEALAIRKGWMLTLATVDADARGSVVDISIGRRPATPWRSLRLALLRLTDPEAYRRRLFDLVTVRTTRLPPS